MLGLDDDDLQAIFEIALLRHIGCTAEAVDFASIMGDELLARSSGGPFVDWASPTEATLLALSRRRELFTRSQSFPVAVLAAAGHETRHPVEFPGGLTSRELEVLRLMARGSSTRSTPEPITVGSAFRGDHQGLGSLKTILTECSRPTRLAFRSDGSRSSLEGVFTIEPVGAGVDRAGIPPAERCCRRPHSRRGSRVLHELPAGTKRCEISSVNFRFPARRVREQSRRTPTAPQQQVME